MSVTDQCAKLLDDLSIEDVIQKDKDYEFDIFFINDRSYYNSNSYIFTNAR